MSKEIITLKFDSERNTLAIDTNFTRPMPIQQLTNLIFTGVLTVLNQTMSKADEADRDTLKGALYDMANQQATALLETFAPEYERNASLTAEALLRYENEVLQDEMSKMSLPAEEGH